MSIISKQAREIRINCSIDGEAAEILSQLKRRGIVGSNRDCVVQALLVFNEKIVDRDLKQARLRNLQEIEDDK